MKLKNSFKLSLVVRWIGRLLSLVAIVFVIRTLSSMEINYNDIFSLRILLGLIICTILQTVLIFVACQSWEHYLAVLGHTKIEKKDIYFTYAKANIYKYLPGNVFQYVGRNELAVKCSIGHKEVAGATILDTITMVLVKLIVSIICLRSMIINVFNEYFGYNLKIIAFVILMITFIISILAIYKSDKIKEIIYTLRLNLREVFKSFLDYFIVDIITGIMYIFLFSVFLNSIISIRVSLLLIGGYTVASVLGFLVPGVPGGLGIREAVIIFLAQGIMENNAITTVAVLMRLICILADIIAFGAMLVIRRNSKSLS